MSTPNRARWMIISAMAIWGTIGYFVRNIAVSTA